MRDEAVWDISKLIAEVESEAVDEDSGSKDAKKPKGPPASEKSGKKKTKEKKETKKKTITNGSTANPLPRAQPKPPGPVYAEERKQTANRKSTTRQRCGDGGSPHRR